MSISAFVYRDVFFRLVTYDSAAYLEAETGKVRSWDRPPTLKELRSACNDWVEKLIVECIRVSGDVDCEECSRPYREHPMFRGAFAFDWEHPYLRRRCDGKLLKL